MFENLLGKEKPVGKPVIQIGTQLGSAPTTSQEEKKDITVEVNDLKKDVDKIKDTINAIKGSVKNLTDKIESIEQNIGQLASVYEVLVNQMNPFLDEDERKTVQRDSNAKEETQVKKVAKEEVCEKEENVVLSRVDPSNPKVIQHILDWMQFLIERVGHEGVDDIINYYVEIKWISEDVAEILKKYAEGIRAENEPVIEAPVQLEPEEHMKSLDYIMQIKEVQ